MKLTIPEMESLLRVLFEMLRARGVESVDTAQRDFYWSVLSDDWLNFQQEPKPAVGSLDDDIEELKRLLSEDSDPSLVDLERIATVLRLLADDLSRSR